MRYLPPLRALIAFEATARHLSVGRAAEELCVTPSAVSHHVRTIENYLRVQLFHRTTRTMQLTDAGFNYLQLITVGLDRISIATRDIADAGFTDVLTIQCTPSFAPAWLVPRLARFTAANPDINLRIRARPDPLDILQNAVDVEIRRPLGETDGLMVHPFLEEEIIPLASPDLVERVPRKSPEDILRSSPLIHSERSSLNWPSWFRLHGIRGINVERGVRFDRGYLSIQAAVNGLGIALESTIFAAHAIGTGQLVRVFENLPKSLSMAHFIVYTQANAHLKKIQKFRDWLLYEAAADEATP